MYTEITITDYMNISIKFDNFVLKNIKDPAYYATVNIVLMKIDQKAISDEVYRSIAYKYFSCEEGSTLVLRELCRLVKFNYLDNLTIDNAIDKIDSLHLEYKNSLKKRK